jgi:antitoxin (DNA-binding transcriptional repressor) of toxin-antitoxin stability system
MVMPNIDIRQAENCLPELIKQTVGGDEIIITDDGQPVVKLIAFTKMAVTEKKNKRRFGSAKGLIKMADDFDETPDDFLDYK